MGWNFRPGIRTEIVLTLTALMVGAVALVGILILKIEERNLLEQKLRSGRKMMASMQEFLQKTNRSLEAGPGDTFWADEQGLMSLFFSNFSVVDRDFRVVADSRPEHIGSSLRDQDLEEAIVTGKILARGGDGKSISLLKKGPLLFSAPLVLRGEVWGGIRGELPLDDLRESLSHSQAMIFLYILVDALLLIVIGSFLLSRVIVNPLKKLVQMSEKIATGDLGATIDPSGGDEVGRLFSSFNRMAAGLRENRIKMEEYIRSLELANQRLRQVQNEVIRSEKLASIGRLAAGVAHEVGNPTGAILGYLDLLSKGGLQKEEEKEILKRAESEADRIRRIVRELLDFSRPSPGAKEQVDVNAAIASALSLLYHQKKIWQRVRVIKEFQEGLPAWKGDPHQLQQMMINLFLNAADAMNSPQFTQMERQATLRVTTRALPREEAEEFTEAFPKRRKGDSPGLDYSLFRARGSSPVALLHEAHAVIRVDIQDTGPGIPREAIDKIFDPFYSTKPPGEGTGLGLPICLRIAESFGGRILVESEEGKGATFTVLLPVLGERDG